MDNLSSKNTNLEDPLRIYIKRQLLLKVSTAILILAFSLAIVATVLKNQPNYWIPMIVCAGLDILLFFFIQFMIPRLKRASNYHWVIAILFYIAIIGMTLSGIWLFIALLGNKAWSFIILGLISLIIGSVIQVYVIKKKLYLTRKLNISSGLLNEKAGEWNLNAVLRLDAPEVEDSRIRFLKTLERLILPFLPAIGITINRNMGDLSQFLILGIILYFLTLLITWGNARYPAIALFLLDLERTLDKKILLVTKKID
jgi:hypothetical protein